ncbi:MAG: hypothetical protein NC339_07210 [Muribaculaceae bacterium]|nr:hypothetical protein [Muribaculaceae bacterium]
MSYNDHNAHPRDQFLSFDPECHVYTYGGREFTSVTTLVEDYFPKFDADKWAPRVALKEGVDPQVIKDRWEAEGKRARDMGTVMHDKIERYYLGDDDGDDADAFRMFREFAAGCQLSPYRTEWRIYHEDYDLAGTLDFLERTPDGTYNLWDWKRSTKLVDRMGNVCSSNNYGKTGFFPLSNLHDTPYWHYALQLSIYSFILEEKYGIHVSKATLGVFHPDNGHPWVLPMPNMRDHVVALLRHRLSARSAARVR